MYLAQGLVCQWHYCVSQKILHIMCFLCYKRNIKLLLMFLNLQEQQILLIKELLMCDSSGSIQLSEEQKSALAFLNRPQMSIAGNKRQAAHGLFQVDQIMGNIFIHFGQEHFPNLDFFSPQSQKSKIQTYINRRYLKQQDAVLTQKCLCILLFKIFKY